MTSWEDASKCPTCGAGGREADRRAAPNGNGKMITLYCRNKTCEDSKVPWYVQVRSDGTIPDPQHYNKQNVILDQKMNNPGLAQQIRDALQQQLDMTIRPGGAEIVRE